MFPAIEDVQRCVAAAFAPIVDRLGATISIVNSFQILLVGPQIAFCFPFDRDGLELWYISRNREGVLVAYRVDGSLTNRANGARVADSCSGEISELDQACLTAKALATMLERYGQDILSGNENWIRDYQIHGGRAIPLSGQIVTALSTWRLRSDGESY